MRCQPLPTGNRMIGSKINRGNKSDIAYELRMDRSEAQPA